MDKDRYYAEALYDLLRRMERSQEDLYEKISRRPYSSGAEGPEQTAFP